MSNRYRSLRQRQQEKFDKVVNECVFFAFNKSQFDEGMKKIGAKSTSELYRLGDTGGYYKKVDAPRIRQMYSDLNAEMAEAFRNGGAEFAKEAFLWEMNNHEYGYTYDLEPVLDALGFSMDEVRASADLTEGLKMAQECYRDCMEVRS